MSKALDGRHETEEMGRPRREADEARLVDEQLAEELIERARVEGVELLGEGGLLKAMTKAVLERALAEELTDHLGYEPGDPAGRESGNSRNGTSPQRMLTEAGALDLDVPRDRAGTFEPRMVGKGQRRLGGIDKLVIGLYARGMSVRDIQAHLVEIYDVEVSPDLISKITDSVLEEVKEWQARPLDRVYPVIFLDAIVCKVRDAGSVKNKAAHWPSASTSMGTRRCWGSGWRPPRARSSGCGCSTSWKARGVEDVLVVVSRRAQGPARRGHRLLGAGGGADLHRASDPRVAALGELQGPQAGRRPTAADLRRAHRGRRPRRPRCLG